MTDQKEKLPPIPDESLDGEKFSTDIKFEKCLHKKVYFNNGELRCTCGAGWSGSNLHTLYTHLKNQ